MAKYTYAQLQQIWKSAGGSAIAAPFAAAIALAESGGDSSATHTNSNGSTDRGLWQINSIHGSLSTLDVNANARAAVQISDNGTNWRPWCTAWSNGACGGTFLGDSAPVFKFFTGNVNALGLSTPNTGGTPTGSGTDVTATNTSLGSVLDPKTWATAFLRPVFVTLFYWFMAMTGVSLIAVGVFLLVSESKTAGLVKSLVPAGRVAGLTKSRKSPVSRPEGKPDTPVSRPEGKPDTPVSRPEGKPDTPVSRPESRSADDLGY